MNRRLKKYAKDPKHKHHYMMALQNSCVIDATVQGNYSRFVNHSCDPNAETQKVVSGTWAKVTIVFSGMSEAISALASSR